MDARVYDSIVGKEMECVVAGESALYRSGLTYSQSFTIDVWTDNKEIPNGIFAVYVKYFYNPMAKDFSYTVESPVSVNIHEPTQERAIVEAVKFRDNISEGVLIEAVQNYLWEHTNLTILYEVADYFKVSRKDIDYWINEAREESDMSMG